MALYFQRAQAALQTLQKRWPALQTKVEACFRGVDVNYDRISKALRTLQSVAINLRGFPGHYSAPGRALHAFMQNSVWYAGEFYKQGRYGALPGQAAGRPRSQMAWGTLPSGPLRR